MDTKLDINRLHTHLLKYPQGDFKQLDDYFDTEFQLSMMQFILPNGEAIEIPLQSLILIGRQAGNEHRIDVDLSKFGAESSISRTHAAIQITHSAVYIRDFESRNGTLLNGEILQPMEDYILRDGDELKLGPTKIRVIFIP